MYQGRHTLFVFGLAVVHLSVSCPFHYVCMGVAVVAALLSLYNTSILMAMGRDPSGPTCKLQVAPLG